MNLSKIREKTSVQNQGFTLIEILLVIAIIAILAVTVFVALNPAQRFQDTRNARRTQDANTVLTAVHEYIVDNDGSYPTDMSEGMDETEICDTDTSTPTCSGVTTCADLSDLSTYLASMPEDPSGSSTEATGYTVQLNTNGQVTVTACHAEGTTIAASR